MKRKELFAFMLAAVMLFTSGGMTTAAQTVSENGGLGKQEQLSSFQAVSENDGGAEDVLLEQETVSANRGTLGALSNPVHYCTKKDDGSDYTQWSYVYFGSYPQSEVTDAATIAAIESAIRTSGIPTGIGKDVWVGGIKYRRISKTDANYPSDFGDKTYRYFKWERIKWKVLRNDGDTLFLLADKAIDSMPFGLVYNSLWAPSEIREWLNQDFCETAFSNREKNAIVNQKVANYQVKSAASLQPLEDTLEYIYLLSADEAVNESYGFCSDYDTGSASRQTAASDYADAKGTIRFIDKEENSNASWWLRTSSSGGYIVNVTQKGYLYDNRFESSCGVCPVMHISLASEAFLLTDDGTSGDCGERTLTGLQVSKTKNVYEQGEALNLDDLKVTANYLIHPERELKAGSYSVNASAIDMKTVGKKTLTVSYTEGGITKTASLTITVQTAKWSITGPSKKLAAGKKVKLTLQGSKGNTVIMPVQWKSSNKKYATVNQNGTVTLKKAGAGKTVTITATAKEDKKIQASYKIKIMQHSVKSIKLKAAKTTLKAGKSITIKASVQTTGSKVNKTLKWSSSNTNYAVVSSKGKVTAKKAGKGKSVTITAVSTDGSNKKAKIKLKIK